MAMGVNDIPILSALRTKMHWGQERQRVLAENIANADSPNFRPRDLTPIRPNQIATAQSPRVAMARTDKAHIGGSIATDTFPNRTGGYEIRPAGNAVNLEDQMMKVANTQQDYQAATSLYSRSLGLMKTAIGRR
jgi:flagellar basal-body rod protein FlgB